MIHKQTLLRLPWTVKVKGFSPLPGMACIPGFSFIQDDRVVKFNHSIQLIKFLNNKLQKT